MKQSATAPVRWGFLALSMLLAGIGLASAQTHKVTYYYTDPQGTILATTDEQGNLNSQADRKPYGEQVMGAPQDGPGYTGHLDDTDSDLVYMEARYYDPLMGRFLGIDPTPFKPGEIASIGRYTYTNNNPITNTDPDGRDCMTNNGTTHCVTAVYDVSFRAQPGFHDFTTASENYHFYSVPVVTNEVNLSEAQAGLIRNPTPGWPLPATATGTKNDATPGIGGMIPSLYLSPVMSFTATNLVDGQPSIVNVTLGNHVLAPGIVVREAVPATNGGVLIQSWGEGTGELQAPGSTAGPLINSVWDYQAPSKPASPTGCTGEGGSTGCLL